MSSGDVVSDSGGCKQRLSIQSDLIFLIIFACLVCFYRDILHRILTKNWGTEFPDN